MKEEKYWSPYVSGVGLGLTLLLAFVLVGRGLGASGAMMRLDVWFMNLIAPAHTAANTYLSRYAESPLSNWLIFEVVGVIIGGFLSGALAGRLKAKIGKGQRISNRGRLILAFTGGAVMGFGARLARGCTSGLALTGGATLAVGGWVFMFAVFAGAYATAYFVRRQWI
ncbi:MAG: YeeE/YedE family protein [Caldithrix sp.]|nr:YeeE/YedE family protein [Caldithrix sp.]